MQTRRISAIVLIASFACILSGCSAPPVQYEPVVVPQEAKLVALGPSNALYATERHEGTWYFVEDSTGKVVWVMDHPGDTLLTPGMLKEVKHPLTESTSYRVYNIPAAPATTQPTSR